MPSSPTTMDVTEAHADAVLALLARDGSSAPSGAATRSALARLRASRRPYLAWALAWCRVTGRLEQHPDDSLARSVHDALLALEPSASALDAESLDLFTESRATG